MSYVDKIYVVYDKVAYIASVEVVWVRIVFSPYVCLFYFCIFNIE